MTTTSGRLAGPLAASIGPREVGGLAERIKDNIERVIVGKPDVVRVALATLFAEGHLLVEDVPGVGKTSLAKALARSVGGVVSRVQCTPDLMPVDITGLSVYNRQTQEFVFHPGPVFANVVIADEINRASPKTQSALLECMAERQVTVDGRTRRLESPFMVVATQNPVEMDGTYVLPEAQRDRFTARVSVGYPNEASEVAMLEEHAAADPLDALGPVTDVHQLRAAIHAVRRVPIFPHVQRYCVSIVAATRSRPELRLGASPRATLQLVRSARAWAALRGRDWVLPDDVLAVAPSVLAHRLLLTSDAQASRVHPADVVRSVLQHIPPPADPRG